MITFYATIGIDELVPRCMNPEVMSTIPILLPASSYARRGLDRAPNLPPYIRHTAADSGGFVATFKWGDYTYSPGEYVAWLNLWHPEWAAMMDYCCEDEITSGKAGVVRERQERTTDTAWAIWSRYRATAWTWVPTVQGWHVDEYYRHAVEMRPLINEMRAFYSEGSQFRVGIGTLCRRASVEMIQAVIRVVAEALGETIPLHLWGVKFGTVQSKIALPPQVVSLDSAAYWFQHPQGWRAAREEMREWSKSHGKTHRHFLYEVALPRYIRKINDALETPKQAMLFREAQV